MNTQTLAPQQVVKGQTVVAVDGHSIRPLTVKAAPELDGATWTIKYEVPTGSVLDAWNHYLEPGQTVTVEMPEPKAKREATYPRTVTRDGYRLRMLASGKYETPDGRFLVDQVRDEFMCGSEEPHPVRYSKADRARMQEALRTGMVTNEIGQRFHVTAEDRRIYALALQTKGYVCEGGDAYHWRSVWRAWDFETEDYAGGNGPNFSDTLHEVLGCLPKEYRTA